MPKLYQYNSTIPVTLLHINSIGTTVKVLYQYKAIGLKIHQESDIVVFSNRSYQTYHSITNTFKIGMSQQCLNFYTMCTWPPLNPDCTDRALLKSVIEKIIRNIYIDPPIMPCPSVLHSLTHIRP